MKYLEELSGGDCFEHGNNYYVLSKDFKSNGDRMCIDMSTGFPKWISSNSIVSNIELFTTDKDNNIVALKIRKNQNDYTKTENIS